MVILKPSYFIFHNKLVIKLPNLLMKMAIFQNFNLFILAFSALATISPILAQTDPSQIPTTINFFDGFNLTDKSTQVISNGPDIARAKKYVYITGSLYCFEQIDSWSCENCLKAKAFGYEFVGQVSNTLTNTLAVIVVNHELKEIVVAFRGTINLPNGILDALMLPTPIQGIGLPYSSTEIRVHSGFLIAVNSLYGKLLAQMQTLFMANPDYELVVAGHSLGAAMGSIFLYKVMEGIDIPSNFPRPASFAYFGYGGPRVGNQVYADYWNNKNMEVTRVVNKRDIVSHIFPATGLASGYIHFGTELWINPSGMDVSCSKSVYEDPNCSNSEGPIYSLLDHVTYWDVEYLTCIQTMPIPFLEQFVFPI